MYSTTLCLPVQGEPAKEILLGWKKTGFGQGKYNGFGGKVQTGETVVEAALRELREECGIEAGEADLEEVGKLDFIFPANPALDHDVTIFLVRRWRGEARETAEMRPVCFPIHDIPYRQMWSDDIYWLPKVLRGDKIEGTVIFAGDNEGTQEIRIRTR
jgi:8-oxo-dGTP diphosphatase